MKASTLLLSAALALGSAASASAQVITTFETLSAWSLSNATSSFSTNSALVQTFQLPAAAPVIYQMAWHFVTPAGQSVSSSSTLDAYVTLWNTATNRPSGAPIWSALSVVMPAYGSGSYNLQLTPDLLTDSSLTYAMILRGTSVASNVHIANADQDDGFEYGQNFRRSTGATSFASLSGLNYQTPGEDWGFSTLSISDSLVPIPETGTVAVVFAGVLVAGLGVRRRLLAKREAVAQTATAA
jgi:hypothetical protein